MVFGEFIYFGTDSDKVRAPKPTSSRFAFLIGIVSLLINMSRIEVSSIFLARPAVTNCSVVYPIFVKWFLRASPDDGLSPNSNLSKVCGVISRFSRYSRVLAPRIDMRYSWKKEFAESLISFTSWYCELSSLFGKGIPVCSDNNLSASPKPILRLFIIKEYTSPPVAHAPKHRQL